MAKNRGKIKEVVELNVGRANDQLENELCDEALDLAITVHPFDDSVTTPSDISITEDSVSVDISSIEDIKTIVTARIVETSGQRNLILKLKNRTWWDNFVVNPEDNQKGWPVYGLHDGTTIKLNCPAEDNLSLRLRVSINQTFDNDNTECPIALLENFVIKFVTAGVFKQLKQFDAAKEWRSEAVGPLFDIKGEPGGLLLAAITNDKSNIGEETSLLEVPQQNGLSIRNLIVGHEDYGNIRTWH